MAKSYTAHFSKETHILFSLAIQPTFLWFDLVPLEGSNSTPVVYLAIY